MGRRVVGGAGGKGPHFVNAEIEAVARTMAAITGRNIGAVKQLQRRGVERLRRHLNGVMMTEAITSVPALPIAEL